jgi:NTP pyrophosphatase (non-canonical NTP hydrolase)
MKTFVIKNLEGENLYITEANSFKEAVEEAVATGIDLTGADLAGADLRGANLFKAILTGADLEGANLEEADLGGTDLRGADLSYTKLKGANLEETSLVLTDLTGANLEEANLSKVLFHNTDYEGINLAGATLTDVNFFNQFENISSLEQKIVNWAEDRGLISEENSKNQFLKTIEEVGELASALAKNDKEALIDAVGDVIVTLVILAKCENLSATDCLASAYKEIKNRKGKTKGGVFIKD